MSMSNSTFTSRALSEAAERVRVARTMAAWRRDDESAKELAEAMAALKAIEQSQQTLEKRDHEQS